MTIRGDGTSLVRYELSRESVAPDDAVAEHADGIAEVLFTRLISDEVDFDTTTGKIEFPFSNGQSDLTGKTTWTRIFQDWVFLRTREMCVDGEAMPDQTLIINGLHQRARQHLGI